MRLPGMHHSMTSAFHSYKADPKKLSDDLDLHEQGWVQDWDYLSRNENRQKYFILSVEELRGLINMAQERLLGPGMPVAWVASHENGRVRHFAKADGWSVEAVLFEPSIPATGIPQEKP